MNAQCSHCKTVFRVDPRKVPAGGVRARCSICRSVFEVKPEGAASSVTAASTDSAASTSATTSAPATATTSAPPAPAARTAAPASAPPTPAPAPAPPPASPSPAPAAAPSAPAPAAPPARPAPAPTAAPSASAQAAAPAPAPSTRAAFGSNDPNAKARRLARALVSDIVTYHPERRDKALQDGTLKREFMEEIKKSWEEYAGQVGPETARGTTFFRDALNDILAKGQQVF